MDWLETLDPEVIGSCPDLQQRLLFSRSKVGCAARTGTRALATPGPSSHPRSLQARHTDRPDLVAGTQLGGSVLVGPGARRGDLAVPRLTDRSKAPLWGRVL